MNSMNKLLKKYGTKKFENLLATVKLGELLGEKKPEKEISDTLKLVIIIVGAVLCVAAVTAIICTCAKKCSKRCCLEDKEYDDFDDFDGSEEE